MGVFDDKKYEELDWISQATEPIESPLNDILAELPDEVAIDFAMYTKLTKYTWGSNLSVEHALNTLYDKPIPYETRSVLCDCFTLVVEGDPEINFEEKTITGGTIQLIKTRDTMDSKVLESILGKAGLQQVMYMDIPRDGGLGRANDIMELLGGCEQGLSNRSLHKKRNAISQRLSTILKDNLWNIRDTTLADKVGTWIKDYVANGNLASYSNFCRLKVMTHKGQPIYSMEEVV